MLRLTLPSIPHVTAELAAGSVRLPFAEIVGREPGPTVTITAGMDGDEYAGIVACHLLYKRYTPSKVKGTIRFLPLVNVAGFRAGTSKSPIDGKYPKFIFPGRANGTHTDELMHWLYETYIKDASLWIDLHGGSTQEKLTPFIWLYQSKNTAVRGFQRELLETTSAAVVVHDRHPFMRYSSFLDSRRIAHVLMECGDLGTHRKKDIITLIHWTDETLSAFGAIKHNSKRRQKPVIYTAVKYVYTPNGDDMKRTQLLWRCIDPQIKKGDVVAAYGLP